MKVGATPVTPATSASLAPTFVSVLMAGNSALGLWVRCGSHCAQHLTDGYISREVALLYGTKSAAAQLVAVGLWEVADEGWVMHDYLDYNPSAERVRAERQADTGRQRNAREAAKSHRESRSPRPNPTPTQPPCRGAAGKETNDRAKNDEPPPHSTGPPGPVTLGPGTAEGYRLVDATIGREHPNSVRVALAIEVNALLSSGTDHDLISAALALWLDKPHLGPRTLPSLVSEAIRNRDHRPTLKSRPSTTDQRIADIQALKTKFTDDPPPHLLALPGGGT
jgi:hypothetical protein